jgi:CRISPR-associated protein Csm2
MRWAPTRAGTACRYRCCCTGSAIEDGKLAGRDTRFHLIENCLKETREIMSTFNTQRGGGSGFNRPNESARGGRPQKEHEAVTETMKTVSAKLRFGDDRPAAELFDTWAMAVAKELAQAKDKFNKISQIRRFYDELVGWQERIKGDQGAFEQYEAFIRMLNAKVAYAKGRDLVDASFEHWFRACVGATKSAAGLDHFRLHFEAVLGFLKSLQSLRD